jgi:GAF domain-containing protein
VNQIAVLTNGSLNLQEVLDKVCQSVTEVAGATHSAIFLLNQEYNEIVLSHSSHLPERFIHLYQRMPMVHNERTRCLRTGQPDLTPELIASHLENNFFAA